MELLLITNTDAGSAQREAVEAATRVLRADADVRVQQCDAAELDAVVAGRGDRRLVVAGGDGSVHALVQTLHARGQLSPTDALGLVPLGTGNDLARTLGIPLEPAEAARVVLTGRPRPLDLLVDEIGGIVVNAVHVGVGAEAAEAAADLKPRLGPVAYPVGAVVAGLGSDGYRLRVEVDGAELWDGAEPVLMVGIGNGCSIGGGAPLTPDAQPDDGLADIVVAAATGALARLGYAAALRHGDHPGRQDVRTARGRVVRLSGEPFPTDADGELHEPVTSRTWTVRPAAWALTTPASGRAS